MITMSMDAKTESLLSELNEPQQRAVVHTDGPLLILAGPGSGKTRVVTRRAAHLARTITQPWHVLAVTFTNKAAREMQERIAALGVPTGMTVTTFHALGARLLRQYHDRAGITRDFTIFDTDDRRKVIKEAVERCDLSSTNWPAPMIEREISLSKGNLQTAEEFAASDVDWRQRTIARIFGEYERLLARNVALDFDDLLMRPTRLLMSDEELRQVLESRFQYVLIDEYQDTNAAQYRLARLLTQGHRNLCATGDPDQSIYGWRGADVENILRFESDYPEAAVVRLEQNYRSTQRILAAADRLVAANTRRKAKSLWTTNEEGAMVRVVECETAEEEAADLCRQIGQTIRAGSSPNDIAVFYRVNSLSRTIEEALIRAGIPYQIARGVEFYRRKEIKDVLAYLRVLVNPADEVSLLRIINTPARGIGDTTIERLTQLARSTHRRLIDVIAQPTDASALGRAGSKVVEFSSLLSKLTEVLSWPAAQAIEHVVSHSGLRASYSGISDVEGGPIQNIDELVSAASDFAREHPSATLQDWLEHTALISDVDAIHDQRAAVTLMTLHAAKGLEFPVVHMIGLENGLLPLRRNGEEGDEEEERRLCFVGMTRARKHLTMSRARYRMLRGITERTVRSPFLDQLPREGVEWIGVEERGSHAKEGASPTTGRGLPEDIELWAVGTLVRHPLHGLGQVVSMNRGARRTHVEVQFQQGQTRSWVLEFAQLERVEFDEVG